ncbi:MAG: GxxExxY protein [Candidatus Spechtbacterales bacterium]
MRQNKYLYENLTYKVRGCVFKVYNELGFGHKEKIYQKALAIALDKEGIKYEREKTLPIKYQNEKVGVYKPDFVVENKVILELKSVPYLPKAHENQLVYYLQGTGYRLGLLINFGSSPLTIKRKIWTPDYTT